MEVIKVQLARAIWLFDTQELNPRGLSLYPDTYLALNERYRFIVLPKSEEIQKGESQYFKHGKFLHDGVQVEVDFDLHGDGLVATTRHSTEASTAFLQDCLGWLEIELGTDYPRTLTKKRNYRSELVVKMHAEFGSLCDKTQPFADVLSEITGSQVRVSGLTFGAEKLNSVLSVERRFNTPFEDDRYVSTATLTTSQHVAALTQFEKSMA